VNVPPPPPPNDPYGPQGGSPQGPWGGQPGYSGAPPGYGPPGYGNAREHPNGTTILVLGILGLVLCQLLGPVAWVMGGRARREMNAQPDVHWTNRGNVTAGWVCGIIGSVLLILSAVFLVIILAAAASGT
jgi:hypothetical protein